MACRNCGVMTIFWVCRVSSLSWSTLNHRSCERWTRPSPGEHIAQVDALHLLVRDDLSGSALCQHTTIIDDICPVD